MNPNLATFGAKNIFGLSPMKPLGCRLSWFACPAIWDCHLCKRTGNTVRDEIQGEQCRCERSCSRVPFLALVSGQGHPGESRRGNRHRSRVLQTVVRTDQVARWLTRPFQGFGHPEFLVPGSPGSSLSLGSGASCCTESLTEHCGT